MDLHYPNMIPVGDVSTGRHTLHWWKPEKFCLYPLGQPKHINGAMHACLDSLDGIMLVVNGRSRAGKVIYFIDLQV